MAAVRFRSGVEEWQLERFVEWLGGGFGMVFGVDVVRVRELCAAAAATTTTTTTTTSFYW